MSKEPKEKPFALRNENLPAYPTEFSYGEKDDFDAPVISHRKYPGVTKKELFLAHALGGLIAKHGAVEFQEADCRRLTDAVDMLLKYQQ